MAVKIKLIKFVSVGIYLSLTFPLLECTVTLMVHRTKQLWWPIRTKDMQT